MLCAWLPIAILMAQGHSPFRARYVAGDTHNVNLTLSTSDTLSLTNYGTIYSLSINATIQQPSEGSFVRIVLEDSDGHDYLVAESDWMRNDTTIVCLSDYCEETAMLGGVTPAFLKCYLTNATLSLHSITASTTQEVNVQGEMGCTPQDIKLLQVQNIVGRINAYNERHGKLWRATATDLALQPYCLRASTLNLPDECTSYGIEYYAGGIFDMGTAPIETLPRYENSLYVESFDWRNKHGKSWITPIKNQGHSGLCWAFSSVALVESMTCLYFNDTTNIDLSEMDVAYYAYAKDTDSTKVDSTYRYHYKRGGSHDKALSYTINKGLVDEESLPFHDDSLVYLPGQRPNNYRECIKTKKKFCSFAIAQNLSDMETLKRHIINKGPFASGFKWIPDTTTKGHSMELVGYHVIRAGDNLSYYDIYDGRSNFIVPDDSPYIGHTYWIFKNSYGLNDGHPHDGYMYILFKNLWCFASPLTISIASRSGYTDKDIIVEDLDGDGYFNWGIGPKPAHCPAWAPDEEDGDDSDYQKGPMDEYGYCTELDSLRKRYIYIENDTTLAPPHGQYDHVVIWKGATVKTEHTVHFENGTELIVDCGSTLIVEDRLENVTLRAMPGSHIIVRHNSTIVPYGDFEIPLGATFEMETKTNIE